MIGHTHFLFFIVLQLHVDIAVFCICDTITNFSRHCGHPHKFDVARQRFFSQKISQFKALSEMFLEAEQYNCLDNHDAFCCEVLRSGGAVDVAKSLEKMRSEVKKVDFGNNLRTICC